MQGFDLSTLSATSFAVPYWLAAAATLLIIALAIFGARRPRARRIGGLLLGCGVLLALVGGIQAALEQWRVNERAADKRAIIARAAELNTRALAQGSALACLSLQGAEAVDAACEQALFARADGAAAAVAYMSAQMALFEDALDLARRGDETLVAMANGLRRTFELDRYGLAAHLLATRDGCTSDDCAFFAKLRDASVLKANIQTHVFDKYVSRHAESWNAKPAVVNVAPPPAPATEQVPEPQAAATPAPPSAKYDFPSSASIPPVNIMTAEPPLPKSPAGDGKPAEAAGEAKPLPIPPKRPQSQAVAPQ